MRLLRGVACLGFTVITIDGHTVLCEEWHLLDAIWRIVEEAAAVSTRNTDEAESTTTCLHRNEMILK